MYGIENPKLCAKNPHFGNDYAPLDEVLRVVEPWLAENKLDLSQTCQVADGHVMFVSQIIDAEGNVNRQVAFPFDPGKAGPQAVGSAITYARRYGILLLFNLIGEKDDDGERGEGRGTRAKKRTPKATKPKATKPTATQQAMADNAVKTEAVSEDEYGF